MAYSKIINKENVAIISMCDGENRHNLDSLSDLLDKLIHVKKDESINAVIITSESDKYFSLGVDLEWFQSASNNAQFKDLKRFMYKVDRIFKELLLFPVPVIAAINGHAFGNGAILACACDFRLMRKDKGYICFPEVDLSIPFLPGMIGFIEKALSPQFFNYLALSGAKVSAEQMLSEGAVHSIHNGADELAECAFNFAQSFNKNRQIFANHKAQINKTFVTSIETENKPSIETLQLMI